MSFLGQRYYMYTENQLLWRGDNDVILMDGNSWAGSVLAYSTSVYSEWGSMLLKFLLF